MKKTSLFVLPLCLRIASFASSSGSRALAQPLQAMKVDKAGDSITFPAHFSLSEFFDLVSQSAETRIIAPGDDKDGLIDKLNESLANRRVSAKETVEKYSALHGLSSYGRSPSLSIVEGQFPSSSEQGIKNSKDEWERKTAARDFILSLSTDQISRMYSDGFLSADLLTPQQKPLYINLVRKYEFGSPTKTISDEELLNRPSKFNFSLTASFVVEPPGKEETFWIGMYDYGTGLIWNPLAPSPGEIPPIKETLLVKQPEPLQLALTTIPAVEFSKTHVWTIREALDYIQEKSGGKIRVDRDLSEETLRETHVILTRGSYNLEELMDGVSATIGAELLPLKNNFYLRQATFRGQLRRDHSLADQFNKVEQTLRRLPPASSAVPFFSSTFEKRQNMPYATLDAAQKAYIRGRFFNEHNEPSDRYAKIDLDKSNILFANTLWFSEFYNDPRGAMITSNYQVW